VEHEKRYRRLLNMVEQGTVYQRETPIKWICSKCGYVHEGKTPPDVCPSCQHPKEYYEPEYI
jgi:rubrerythrin